MKALTKPATKKVVTEITDLYESFHANAQKTLDSAIALGEKLEAVKERVPHGEWEGWVLKNLPFSIRYAGDMLSLAREKDGIKAISEATSDLTVTAAVRQSRQISKHGGSERFLQEDRISKGLNSAGLGQSWNLLERRAVERAGGETPEHWGDEEEDHYQRYLREDAERKLKVMSTHQERNQIRKERQERSDELLQSGKIAERAKAGVAFEDPRDEEAYGHWKQKREADARFKRAMDDFARTFTGFSGVPSDIHLDDPNDDAEQQSLFAAMDTYFGRFKIPSHRHEAIANVLKWLKGKAIELDRESTK